MDKTQSSIWEVASNTGQNSSVDERDKRERDRNRRSRAAYASKCCCCPCSNPTVIGLLIGALVAGIGFATILSIYLIDSSKSTSAISMTTITLTTATSTTATSSTVTTATTTTSTSSTTTSTTTTAPYCTTRVTFDDIPGQLPTSGAIPNGYKNLNWTNSLYLNASIMPSGGYQIATYSPPFVAYNPGGAFVMITTANGTRFAFNSIVATAAWRDSMVWSIYGIRAGSTVVSGSLLIHSVNRTTITCTGCSNFDTMYMVPSGGIPRSNLSQNGTEFAFDDLCISFGY